MRSTRYWEEKAQKLAAEHGAEFHRRHCAGMGYIAILRTGKGRKWAATNCSSIIDSDIMVVIDKIRQGVI